MRSLGAFILTVILIGVSVSFDVDLVSSVNDARVVEGLPALTADGDLQALAEKHSAAMVDAESVFHSGLGYAENVGRGPTVADVFAAFLGSSDHRANILGDHSRIGVGISTHEGFVYVTVLFAGSTPVDTTVPPATTTTTTGKEHSCR